MESKSGSESTLQFRPSILSASWRYRWLVLGFIVLTVALGLYWASTQPTLYTATARLVVDPAATVVSEGVVISSDRYQAVQVVVLRSPPIAIQAVQVAERDAEGLSSEQIPTTEEFLTNTDIIAIQRTDLIEIRFEAESPDKAVLGANSLAIAYQEVRESEAKASATAATERVDALIASAEEDIAILRSQIDEAQSGGSDQAGVVGALEQQLAGALDRLVELQDQLVATTDPDEVAIIRGQLNDISKQIVMYEAVRSLGQDDPNLAGLLRAQDAAIDRRARLSERKDVLEVDAELVSSGVTSFLPATFGVPSGSSSLARTAIVMAVFGGLIGGVLAYLLASRRRTFDHRNAPEGVLNTPLLADVPDFGQEDLSSLVPVRSDPHSVAAESFRFALASLDVQLEHIHAKSVVVVSAGIGTGKTIITANSALAAVRRGYRVLAVDADFGNQALTELLTGSGDSTFGLTEAVNGNESLEAALREVPSVDGSLWLLSRGTSSINAVDFFRSDVSFDLFDELKDRFDLVLIDSPSMLQVAYGTTLARHADAVIAVVAHGDQISEVGELADRLAFVDSPVAGYVYNRAPLRPEMARSEGSLSERQRSFEEDLNGRHATS